MIMHGLSLDPLDPYMFQFIAHSFLLKSLTAAFVGKWHFELCQTIRAWIQLGPEGNPSTPKFIHHFAT